MAVSTTTTYSGPYFPNGVTVEFPFTFKVVSTDEVSVVRVSASGEQTTVAPADYSVSLSGDGGTVTFATAPASGSDLYVVSNPLFTQTATFSNQAYNPAVLNSLFDRDAVRAQKLRTDVGRALRTPLDEAPALLPSAAERAAKVLAFDGDGNPVALSGSAPPDALGLPGGADLVITSTGDTVEEALAGKTGIATLASTIKGEGAGDVGTELGTVEARLYRSHNYAPKVNPAKTVPVGGKSVVRTNLRKPKLVILLGQSGAEGRATAADANASNDTTGTRSSVQIWTGAAFADLYVPRNTSETGNNDAQAGRHGIELALANFVEAEAIQTTTTETAIHMVKVTEGGTFMGQWLSSADIIPWDTVDPNNPDDDGDLSLATPGAGVLDTEALNAVNGASAAMDTLYGAGNWEPVLIMIQGEANGTSPTQFPRFKRQRKTFNARWRTRLGSTLRIIQPHILAYSAEYIGINSLLNEIEYEDDLSYVLAGTAYLPTDDGIHLNYFGMAQLGQMVARELYNPTTKSVARPKVYSRDLAGASTLLLENTDEVVFLTGTTIIDRAPLSSYWEGRRLVFLRTEAGAGISIRHESGSTSTHTLFRTLTAATVAMAAGVVQRREFIGIDGYFQEVPVRVAQQTGWTAGTGTANKGAFATYAGQTISATPTQAEVQTVDNAAKANAQRIKAIEDALRAIGAIN